MESKEWADTGLPPIGLVCEYYGADGKWRKCEIVAYYFANVVAVDVLDSAAVLMQPMMFRPIKTPEQIAIEDRLHAVVAMMDILGSHCALSRYSAKVLYDAGYRKTEVKK